jgi:ubiquinone/menaquinone biosynthesis C-methylase UbiE
MVTPSDFYRDLGATGLAARKSRAHTIREISQLRGYLKKGVRILDLACGYGRLTIPLAKCGYNVQGIDISADLISFARRSAKNEGLKIRFKLGDMRKLPYDENSFDNIICMWSAFIEIIREKDQITALRQMLRVLDESGMALLEMPPPKRKKERVIVTDIDGIESPPMYMHDKSTMKSLMQILKPRRYRISTCDFGGRDRLIVMFWK